ncbi:MAG: 30S ribosomal protein S1 [Chloroflexi bacterium]|nr:30S ribosomal protein S1 [Chloroflexota bacterium]
MTEPQQADADTEPTATTSTEDAPIAVASDASVDTSAPTTDAVVEDTPAVAPEEAPAAVDETPAAAAVDETPTAAPVVEDAPDPVAAEATPVEASDVEDVSSGLSADDLAAAPAADEEDVPAPRVDPRPEPTTMEELLNEQEGDIRSLKHGDVVEGTVVRIDKDEMLVDIGAKSEGVVSNRELYGRNTETQPQLNIGDTVLVYVLQPESNEGHAVLSLRRAGLERKWRAMQEQLDAGAIIEAPVIDHNKGGLIVDCGIRGFVPISQIVDFPRRPQNEQPRDAAQEIAEKLQPYVGRKLRLKILEVNRKANRLILSEKVALYEERREKRDELFSSLQVGQHVKGNVRSIAPFGVFVDLGGIDGLVHKSELSWNKVNNPESGYHVGEEVEAEVIDINHERGRISLSIRRLQPDPWNSTVADLKVGDIIEGTVTKIVNFGAFVRVREGLEGLIHISELSHQRVAHPGDVVHEGQRLKLKVISLDSERHRLGLSLKQAEEAPARPEPRERRPRPERSYDPSQAVQEPEGGIDNTLAAAFAQVRAQVAQQESARASAAAAETEDVVGLVAETVADDVAAVAEAEVVAEADVAADVAELAVAEEAIEAAVAADVADVIEAEEAAEAALAAAAPELTTDELVEAVEELAEAETVAEAAIAEEVAEAEAITEETVADETVAEAVDAVTDETEEGAG